MKTKIFRFKNARQATVQYLLFAAFALVVGVAQAQINWSPNYKIGTVDGVYNFSSAQTPSQLVYIYPAIQPSETGCTYQWEQSSSPLFTTYSNATGTSTGTSYSFTRALSQTTYFRRKVTKSGWGFIYSNIIKISIVSANWEDINYIREHDILTTGITTFAQVDALAIGQKLQTTTYLDGLGRSVEKVSRETATATSGTWGDIVQFSQYDVYGRQPKQFLPYTTTMQPGKYKTTAPTEQTQYFTTKYSESSPYNSLTYDNSPLNRVTNVKESGINWAASNGNSVLYDLNTAAENVQIWYVNYSRGGFPATAGAYPDNTLLRNKYTDVDGNQVIEYSDNAGKLILKKVQAIASPSVSHSGWICTYFVYDDFGLLRYQLQPEAVKYLDANGWVFTAQVLNELCFQYDYDDKGRTIWKKAPGAQPLQMMYDARDRMVFTQDGNQAALSTPQWTANLYDDLDRPTLTTLYNTTETVLQLQTDITNAATNTTVSTTPPAKPITDLVVSNRDASISTYSAQNSITLADGFSSGTNDAFTAQISATAATTPGTVTSTTYNNPITSANLGNASVCIILKYLFYDDYSFGNAKPFDNTFTNTNAYATSDLNVIPIAASKRTLSYPTGSLTRVLESTTFLAATDYYDEKGRHIQSQEENVKGGTDATTLQYHWDGRLLSTCHNHTAPGTDYIRFITLTKNIYDKIGRVTSIQKSVGANNPLKTVSSYDYDDMGRVKTKHLDPTYTAGGNAELESLNYSFNIHNQITGINKDYAKKTSGTYNKWGHFFGMYLGFDKTDGFFTRAELNGQVTGVLWNTQGDDAQRMYNYRYDNAGRLINAAFTEQQHPGDGFSNAKMDFSVTGTSGQITYDLNGNLLTMLQRGVQPGAAAPIAIDDLRYSYAAQSNKLQSVTDAMTATTQNGLSGDFKDGSNGSNPDYVYDNNGNVVIDLNKNAKDLNGVAGANGIHYNFLDKPDQIRIAGKGTIAITYSADGDKLQRTFTPETAGITVTTSYISQFVYRKTSSGGGDSLQYMSFEEGRVRVMQAVSQGDANNALMEDGNIDLPGGRRGAWDYFVMDYQQNVRMILTEETHTAYSTATMETAQQTYEDGVFGQPGAGNEVEATRVAKPAGWTNAAAGASVCRLGNTFGKTLGPNTLQKVMAGDALSATVLYYCPAATTGSPNNTLANTIVSNLLGVLMSGGGGATGAVKGNAGAVTTQLGGNGAFTGYVQPSNTTGTIPQAYLTILFFDERFNFISASDGGAASLQITGTTGASGSSLTLANVKAPKNGYAYAYVSNRSDQSVYFDNLKVQVQGGNIIEENHYYAFGLKIASISSVKLGDGGEGGLKNSYLYNDKELIDDADLNWYDYGFRNYDPQIGRFTQLDPLTDDYPELTPYQYASNDPITNIDIDGLEGGVSVFTGATQAAADAAADAARLIGTDLTPVVVTATRVTVQATVKTVSTTSKMLSIAGKAADVISNFIPVVSGAKDIYQGAKSGNWWQVAAGAGSIALDIFTLGADELVTGTIRTVAKEGAEQLVKNGAEQIVKEEAEQVVKSETKQLVEKKGLQRVEEGAGKLPCGCFLAGTLVLTDSGYRPIEKIKPGDKVWAYNDTTHTFDQKKVVRVFEHVRDTVYQLHIGTEVISTTSDHPFFVGGRWLRVAKLHVGDSVTTYHGNKIAIAAIDIVAKRTTVHNFEVADYHTYYVSHQQVLVHNNGPCDNFKNMPPDHPDYKAPKNWNGKKVNSSRGKGFPHKNGEVWVPENHSGTHANHWDVQPAKGPGYRKVYPIKQSK